MKPCKVLISLLLPTIITLSGCHKSSAERNYNSEVRTSIKNAVLEMETYSADNQKYPKSIPWKGYKPAEGVIVELVRVDDNSYTIKASHPKCDVVMLSTSGKSEITEQPK